MGRKPMTRRAIKPVHSASEWSLVVLGTSRRASRKSVLQKCSTQWSRIHQVRPCGWGISSRSFPAPNMSMRAGRKQPPGGAIAIYSKVLLYTILQKDNLEIIFKNNFEIGDSKPNKTSSHRIERASKNILTFPHTLSWRRLQLWPIKSK